MTSIVRRRMSSADRTAIFVTAVLLLLVLRVIVRRPAANEARTHSSKNAYSLEFDGENSHVRIPKLRYDGSHPITLEAIVTPYARAEDSGRSCIVGNIELSGVAIHYVPKSFLFHYNEGRDNNGGYASTGSDEEAEVDKSVHVAGVFDGSQVRLYVDGKLQKEVERTTNPHRAAVGDFMVGADPNKRGEPHQFFKGRVDEVRISKVARYAKDFARPQKQLASDGDTLVLYHFDEGNGGVAKDASGNAYDGTIEDAKWIQANP